MMNTPGPGLVTWKILFIASLCFGLGRLGVAQSAEATPPKKAGEKKITVEERRARGIARCRENRGVDCDTPEGQKEWINQERPITDQERAQAAGARRAREAAKRQ
jgi:hypothetical protein